MEFIRISEQKLKIMLTPTDMCHFQLDPAKMEENAGETKHLLKQLFKEIKKEMDFDAEHARIAVQYFPSREGGCEMFISRLCEEPDKEIHLPGLPSPSQGGFIREFAYHFTGLSSLLSVCRRLQSAVCIEQSSVFREHDGGYLLFLSVRVHSPFSTPDALCFLAEYGTQENAAHQKVAIGEHGFLICSENAIHQLANL